MMLPNPFEPAFETCLIEAGYSTGKTLPQRDLGKCEVAKFGLALLVIANGAATLVPT
ncbi:hypothetical protein MPLSOD_40002 [Mesorhizobium sp. SOD10]|nr:hypothetical protein MPLSOD_40002 [Mesorhizobium sp. SOD10]